MSAPTLPTLPIGEVKQDQIYELHEEVRTTSWSPYKMTPGLIWVRYIDQPAPPARPGFGGYPGTCTVINLTSGNLETLYPVPLTLPAKAVRKTKALLAQCELAQRRRPGHWVSLGAHMSLGTDPECFVLDENGMVIPAFDFLPTKEQTHKEGWKGTSYHRVAYINPYWDGFQAEYNVNPFNCIAHLTDCIQYGLRALHTRAIAHDPKARLTGQSVVPVPPQLLADGSEEHIQLGCTPSLNAYGDAGLNPGNGRTLPVRFAGFHMHFGMPAVERENTEALHARIRMMDKVCGVLSVAVLAGMEDPVRRRYYGIAGEYRLPSHGLEWRVLSSAVLWHPALVHLHFNMARAGFQLASSGLSKLWLGTDEEAREVINTLDVERAQEVLKRNRDLYIGLMKDTYGVTTLEEWGQVFDDLLIPGFARSIELDIPANWKFDTHSVWTGHSGSANCHFADFVKRHFGWDKRVR